VNILKYIALQPLLLLMLTLTPCSLIWAEPSNSATPLVRSPSPSATLITTPASPASSVAIVNGQSISAAQLNAASARLLAGVSEPAAQLRIKNQVLSGLINQTLVMQAIAKNQFVLSEDDQLQIENLYQQAVLNFYLAKQAGAAPKPNNQAIDDYIRKNHNAFEKRKTYHFTQILIESDDTKRFETIKALVQKGATLNDLTTWLTQEKVPYSRNNVWRGTEQINPATVTTLEALKNNVIEVQLTPDQKLIQVLELQGAYADPVSIEDARSGILRGIAQDASSKAAKLAMDNLRAKSEILITDSALAQSIQATPLESSAYIAPISMLSKIAALWWFALLLLVPACAITLYRQITPASSDPIDALQDADLFRAARLPDWMSIYTLRIPIIALLSIVLLYPLVSFLLSPPIWITIPKLTSIALAGLCLGFGIVLALYKLKALHGFLRKKWLPVGVLLIIELVLLIIQ